MAVNNITTNKRGMFFTLIALLIVGLLVLVFSSKVDTSIKGHLPVLERRITSVNAFVSDIENTYIERMLRIATLSSFNAMIDYQKAAGFIMPEQFDSVFAELALNGTINNVPQAAVTETNLKALMKTLSDISDEELHIDAIFYPIAINVFQNNETGPWHVGINFTINYFVDSRLETPTAWNRSSNKITKFRITQLEDPVYTFNAVSDFRNIIIAENFKGNWTADSFKEHIRQQTYRQDPKAPSYLQRLINDSRASTCCGIHSMINLNLMEDEPNRNATFVDYCYWSDVCLGDDYGNFIWTVDEITNENLERNKEFYRFKLDTYHIGRYNLTDYTAKLCMYDFQTGIWNGTGCV